jgi:hypothetical protein
LTLDPRLDPERCTDGRLTNEQFREVLETAVIDFVAAQFPKRRRKGRRDRSAAPIEPLSDVAPDDTDELIEELPEC